MLQDLWIQDHLVDRRRPLGHPVKLTDELAIHPQPQLRPEAFLRAPGDMAQNKSCIFYIRLRSKRK